MAKSNSEITAANQAAWDASAPYHRQSERFEELRKGFAAGAYSCLDDVATGLLTGIGVAGKDVAQLCCNNGRELLSVKNLGAASCTGFDLSAPFLEQGRELAAAGRIDCRFVHTDANVIGSAFDRAFDLVFVTIGVLGWMPDLSSFLGVATRLLRPGGVLFIYEQHPVMTMFEVRDPDPYRMVNSYFRKEPFVETGAIVYDGTAGLEGSVQYWFPRTMADIITACLGQGLTVEHFREYAHNISSDEWDVYNDRPAQLPQSYTLIARKT
jgi:ubiquinone/menaquinone biosynthesis C-methylase UbiE